MEVVLASRSPRRENLLKGIGWDVTVALPKAEESVVFGESPEDMVCRLARTKAASVLTDFPGHWLIGADTVVAAEGETMGKPHDREDAIRMIKKLQGKTHKVITGVALFAPNGRCLVDTEITTVRFRPLDGCEAAAYVDSGECFDKAGSYAIQGKGILLVESIEGCYFNVVGLPLQRLSRMFSDLGLPLREQWRKLR